MKIEELDHQIEKSFRTEPGFRLPDDFTNKLVAQIVRRGQWKNDLLEYLYLSGILMLLLAIVSGTYYLVNKEFLLKVVAYISENIISVILIALLINFIIFADRVLLRLLFSRWSKI